MSKVAVVYWSSTGNTEAMRAHAKEMVFPIGAPNDGFSHLAIEVPGENSSDEWLEVID